MKAISILQPWASLIVCGAKDVENRTWTTAHRGPLAICAGKAHDKVSHETAKKTIEGLEVGSAYGLNYEEATLRIWTSDAACHGGLVGVVDLVDIVRDSASPWAVASCFHWILANPRVVPFVAVKGRLGLFDVEVVS